MSSLVVRNVVNAERNATLLLGAIRRRDPRISELLERRVPADVRRARLLVLAKEGETNASPDWGSLRFGYEASRILYNSPLKWKALRCTRSPQFIAEVYDSEGKEGQSELNRAILELDREKKLTDEGARTLSQIHGGKIWEVLKELKTPSLIYHFFIRLAGGELDEFEANTLKEMMLPELASCVRRGETREEILDDLLAIKIQNLALKKLVCDPVRQVRATLSHERSKISMGHPPAAGLGTTGEERGQLSGDERVKDLWNRGKLTMMEAAEQASGLDLILEIYKQTADCRDEVGEKTRKVLEQKLLVRLQRGDPEIWRGLRRIDSAIRGIGSQEWLTSFLASVRESLPNVEELIADWGIGNSRFVQAAGLGYVGEELGRLLISIEWRVEILARSGGIAKEKRGALLLDGTIPGAIKRELLASAQSISELFSLRRMLQGQRMTVWNKSFGPRGGVEWYTEVENVASERVIGSVLESFLHDATPEEALDVIREFPEANHYWLEKVADRDWKQLLQILGAAGEAAYSEYEWPIKNRLAKMKISNEEVAEEIKRLTEVLRGETEHQRRRLTPQGQTSLCCLEALLPRIEDVDVLQMMAAFGVERSQTRLKDMILEGKISVEKTREILSAAEWRDQILEILGPSFVPDLLKYAEEGSFQARRRIEQLVEEGRVGERQWGKIYAASKKVPFVNSLALKYKPFDMRTIGLLLHLGKVDPADLSPVYAAAFSYLRVEEEISS